jgi:hypothetical protein
MPNLVAFVSFAENLIENLLSKDLISIHRLQTDYFEKSLKNLFKKYGYKVINDEKEKKYRGIDGYEIGDFDLLAYKDGVLIQMELKLTNTRNSYAERKLWKDKHLLLAKRQLDKGLKFIRENPDQLRKILNLKEKENIDMIDSFIVSNSFLYDHEKIEDYLKIGYFEVMLVLFYIDTLYKNNAGNAERFVKCINENFLYSKIEELPLNINDAWVNIGDYSLLFPGVVMQNLYSAL